MFFSDLEVELLTFKILFLIFLEFFFWNLKNNFKANALICVGVKLEKIWVESHWIEKKLFSKKTFFWSKFVFRRRKKIREKMLFFEEIFFDSMYCAQILSNLALTHIKTSAIYFFSRFRNLKLPFWHGLSPTEVKKLGMKCFFFFF